MSDCILKCSKIITKKAYKLYSQRNQETAGGIKIFEYFLREKRLRTSHSNVSSSEMST
jgi:hypothetical protein